MTLPAADKGRGSLFPRFGKRGHDELLPVLADFPVTVNGARFQTVAKTAATRWGLKALRWTSVEGGRRRTASASPASRPTCRPGVLGVQTDFIKRGKVVERDLALRAARTGPPGRTIRRSTRSTSRASLIHELGHMAGNKKHTRALRELADGRGARRRRVVARGARQVVRRLHERRARVLGAEALVHRIVRWTSAEPRGVVPRGARRATASSSTA